MNRSNTSRFTLVYVALAAAALLSCSDSTPGGVRAPGEDPNPTCSEFSAGANLASFDFGVEASIRGDFSVFAQASSDAGADAVKAVSELDAACRAIVAGLGAMVPPATGEPRDAMKAACTAAGAAYKAAFGGKLAAAGPITFSVSPAAVTCTASISAFIDCQGTCLGTGKCDIKANPPQCDGGAMIISCLGECTAAAGGELWCSRTPCQASAESAVECDGKCSADFSYLRCERGELKGGCNVSSACACSSAVAIGAVCPPVSVTVTATNASSLNAADKPALDLAINALQTHLPTLLRIGRAKGSRWSRAIGGLPQIGTAFQANATKLGTKGLACARVMTTADTAASLSAAAAVAAAMGALSDVGVP